MANVKVIFKVVLTSLCLLLLALFSYRPAFADLYTYTYTGNDFTTEDNYPAPPGPSASDNVTGWVTLSTPLPASSSLTSVLPNVISFSFTDQYYTVNSSNVINLTTMPEVLQFGTSGGTISEWSIGLPYELSTSGPTYILIYTTSEPGDVLDQSSLEQDNNPFVTYEAEIEYDPGTWTSSVSSSPVPEPTAMLLLGSGLLGLAGLRRMFKK